MEISNKGLMLIKKFEGLRLESYQDVAGVWTIGVGTTVYPNGEKVKEGDKITREEALAYLKSDVKSIEDCINKNVHVPINQNQFDALVSLVYNIGTRAFSNSTLLKILNSGEYNVNFKAWCHANGQYVKGLRIRRVEEQQLFNT